MACTKSNDLFFGVSTIHIMIDQLRRHITNLSFDIRILQLMIVPLSVFSRCD